MTGRARRPAATRAPPLARRAPCPEIATGEWAPSVAGQWGAWRGGARLGPWRRAV